MNGALASGSAVTVAVGATLGGGSGTVGPVTVNGTLAPGGAAPTGVLNTGNLVFASGATFAVDVNGTTAGSGYDQANVTGTVTLNNATLTVTIPAGFRAASGATFILINNDGADPVPDTFAGQAEASTISAGGQNFTISYQGGDGNALRAFC